MRADTALIASALPSGARVAVLSLSGAQTAALTLALRSPFPPGSDASRVFLKALASLLRQRLACGLRRESVAPPHRPTLATVVSVREPLLLLTLTTGQERAAEALAALAASPQQLLQVSAEEVARALEAPTILRRSTTEAAFALLLEPSARLEDAPMAVGDFLAALPLALSPSNLTLAASLPGDSSEFARSVVSILGTMGGEGSAAEQVIRPAQVLQHVGRTDEWTDLSMVLVHPVESSVDLAALQLASALLAHARFSRLFSAARSAAALTYDIDSSVQALGTLGAISVRCTIARGRASEALTLLSAQVRSLAASGPAEGELEAAKRFVAFEQGRLRDRPAQWSQQAAVWVGNFGPKILDLSPEEALHSIKAEDMAEFLSVLVARWAVLAVGQWQ